MTINTKLQKRIGKTVIILEAEDLDLEIEDFQVNYDFEIKITLFEEILFWGILILIRDFLIIMTFMYSMESMTDDIDRDAIICLRIAEHLFLYNPEESFWDILPILDRALESFEALTADKETDELLRLVSIYLANVSFGLAYELRIEEMQIKNIQQWDIRSQKQRCMKLIDEGNDLLKQFSKRRNRRAKLDLLNKLKEKLQEISDSLS